MVSMHETPILHRTHDDRRTFPRMTASGSVTGYGLGTRSTRVAPVHIELRDISVSGVSGWSDRNLRRGERVHINFPADGFKRGFNTFGKVVRCDARATGYQVAIQFDQLLRQ
ncbi:MAG: PilZ domain-containing protein [Burkholderiales bacterium]|nr:PilZ domain-containing protein [Phycisphaerae bacterium]